MTGGAIPTWVQYSQALATPVIAVVGTIIAFGQLGLAKARLQHELFDRRYAVFEAARKFLAGILREGDCQYDQIFEFVRNTSDGVFLFDEVVTAYLEEMKNRAFEIRKAEAVIGMPNEPNRQAAIDAKYRHLEWFTQQFPVLVDKFKPFLELTTSVGLSRLRRSRQ